ncbi:hypothetical protein [Salinirubrum litoreum]|uniref:DUF8120 domain-containing protein n=1 Tax=Salinirubrum litoreum TaxID=1126234 RepID=A0ABD5RBZ2_9EURY|nr:hypothetical protein [Salinirubrum litoreum]
MGDAEAAAAGERAVGTRRPALSPRTYRYLDRATKLVGVGLVAAGLNAGGDTLTGLTLGVVGALLALTTVFLRSDP